MSAIEENGLIIKMVVFGSIPTLLSYIQTKYGLPVPPSTADAQSKIATKNKNTTDKGWCF